MIIKSDKDHVLVTYGTTAASSTEGWDSKMASNSAGATCTHPKRHNLIWPILGHVIP